MDVKERNIYEVELGGISVWNEDNDFPDTLDHIDNIDGKDPTLITVSLAHAYCHYLSYEKLVEDANIMLQLYATKIIVTDEEWNVLLKKDNLSFDDYAKYLKQNSENKILAYALEYNGMFDDYDKATDELLIEQSENFNMKIICEKAGINYSTFRGFKYNHQYFSKYKMYRLLKCMNTIGVECWSPELESRLQAIESHFQGSLLKER